LGFFGLRTAVEGESWVGCFFGAIKKGWRKEQKAEAAVMVTSKGA
jgi:hypothetical protein